MLELVKAAKLMVETCARVKPEERVLVIADDEFPMKLGRLVMDAANDVGAEAVMTLMKPREITGQEPPDVIAAAMKSVNAVIIFCNRHGISHTNARRDATAAGVRVYAMSEAPEDYFNREITSGDIEQIKKCTEALTQKLTKARRARVTTPAGTNVTMSLEGREGVGLHPMFEVLGTLPDYGEAAIAPVEGTAEGIIIFDIGCVGFGHMSSEPIKCVVRSGRVVEISGGEDADRLRRIAATDENASNIAELGIGTSHTVPGAIRGTRRDAARIGTAHIAIGRNNDIGGQTWSRIHVDGLMNCPTIELDGKIVARNGEL